MMVERHQVDAELEALRVSATLVWDLVLGGASGSSSLAASLAMVVAEVEKWINVVAANGVWWRSDPHWSPSYHTFLN
jgi:hypothetical protein